MLLNSWLIVGCIALQTLNSVSIPTDLSLWCTYYANWFSFKCVCSPSCEEMKAFYVSDFCGQFVSNLRLLLHVMSASEASFQKEVCWRSTFVLPFRSSASQSLAGMKSCALGNPTKYSLSSMPAVVPCINEMRYSISSASNSSHSQIVEKNTFPGPLGFLSSAALPTSRISQNSIQETRVFDKLAITRNTVEVLHVITPFYAQNRNFSNKPPKIDRSRVPELREEDLEEKFICGWGPGGQSINKTASAVYLRNIPSGLFVKCQTYRAQHQNRKEARLLLQEKLDMLMNGEDSVVAQKRRLLEAKSSRRENKSKKRRQLQAAWKQSLLDEEPKSLSTEAGLTVNNDSQ